jgi:transcription elongation factor GreB
MSRYRPPAPKSSPYITREGYERLQAEARTLWVKRREVTAALAAAAAEGDRSENAEYIYRKKQLREMDRRIRYLGKRLPEFKVVDPRSDGCEQVFFGAWVTLEAEDGEEVIYRIVGPDEFDPKRHWISIDSPMARALLKKQPDDDVNVETPDGPREYLVVEVSYRDPAAG